MRVGMIAPPWFPLPPQRLRRHRVRREPAHRGAGEARARRDAVRQRRLAHARPTSATSSRGRRSSRSRTAATSRWSTAWPPTRRRTSSTSSTTTTASPAGPWAPSSTASSARPWWPRCTGPPTPPPWRCSRSLRDDLAFIAISDYQRDGFPDLRFVGTIPNAVDVEHMPFEAREGRLLPVHRPHDGRQGRAQRHRGRAPPRRAAHHGRQGQRGPGARVLRRAGRAVPLGPHPLPRRGGPRHQDGALQARPLHAVPHPVARAVRPGDDRVAWRAARR